MYISREEYELTEERKFWKVFTQEASSVDIGFSDVFIGSPEQVHTGSYINFEVNTEEEAKSLQSYLRLDKVNALLRIKKMTQHNNKSVVSFIPLVPLDEIWTEERLEEYLS